MMDEILEALQHDMRANTEHNRDVLARAITPHEQECAVEMARCIGRARSKLAMLWLLARGRDPRGAETLPHIATKLEELETEISEVLDVLGLRPGQEANRRHARAEQLAANIANGTELP